jgi:hypothetical protein
MKNWLSKMKSLHHQVDLNEVFYSGILFDFSLKLANDDPGKLMIIFLSVLPPVKVRDEPYISLRFRGSSSSK